MKKDVNKTLMGAFILGAVALAVIAVLAFGGGNLLQETERYVLYFKGSVKGLSVGAPVQLKGITIGQVVDINPIYDAADKSFLNQVIFEVPEAVVQITRTPRADGPSKKLLTTDTTIDNMIDIGLRAKLQPQSVLTGQLLVAFDFYPDTPVNMMQLEDNMREYPTLPSDMETLVKTFDSIDFKAVAESIRNAATGIDKLANAPDLHRALSSVNETLKRYGQLASSLDGHVTQLSTEVAATMVDIRQLVKTANGQIAPVATGITDTAAEVRMTLANLDDRLQPVMQNLEATTVSARDAFRQAQAVLGNLAHLSNEDSALAYRINDTLAQLSKAAAALALLADYLSRHPEALLQGKGAAKGDE